MSKKSKKCPMGKESMKKILSITKNNSGQVFNKCNCGFASTSIVKFKRWDYEVKTWR